MKTTNNTSYPRLVFLFYQIETIITSHAKCISRVLKRFTSLLFHCCKTAIIVFKIKRFSFSVVESEQNRSRLLVLAIFSTDCSLTHHVTLFTADIVNKETGFFINGN